MAVLARKTEAENPMEARLTRLEERTEHIQRDISEMKGDIRRVDSKLDAFKDSVEARFAALMEKMSSIETTMIKWMIGTLIAAVTLAFAIAKFFS